MNFVTLFDKGYLSRGIALYESLQERCQYDFTLYVLAMDDYTADFFDRYNGSFQKVKVITISDIKEAYPILERIHRERSHREFCWTMSSFSVQYTMNHFDLDDITYLDSDIYFFYDPKRMLEGMKEESVLITPHNFSPEFAMSIKNAGKFCVEFVYFKNDEEGRRILERWRRDCEEACSETPIDGMYGDQMYLNDWESRYPEAVYVSRLAGGGVGPWNLQQYSAESRGNEVWITNNITKVQEPIVFFHYTMMRRISCDSWYIGNLPTNDDFRKIVYRNYAECLYRIEKEYGFDKEFDESAFREVNLTRFMPVPYTGDRKIKCVFENTENQLRNIRIYSLAGSEEGAVFYEKTNHAGQWIIIDHFENCKNIGKYMHEFLWEIMYHECFAGYSMQNEIYFEILRRAKKGELLMMECESEKLSGIEVKYPCTSMATVVREEGDIISNDGATVYRDLVIYGNRIVTVGDE